MIPIDDLDATATLAAVEESLRRRRAAEVEDLLLVCHWADLHASDPRRGSAAKRCWQGEDRLVQVGGDGTPLVRELSLPELAVARRTHTLSTRAVLADALDLRHRLPRTFAVVASGGCEAWLARRVASMCRALDHRCVHVVDDAVADAIAGESPARVLAIAQAKTIEADPAAYAARLEAELRKRYVGASRIDDHGLRTLYARLEAGPAEFLLALVEQVTDALDRRRDLVPHVPPDASRDELRAEAFGWLAHPAQVMDLLDQDRQEEPAPGEESRRRPRPRSRLSSTSTSPRPPCTGGASPVSRTSGRSSSTRSSVSSATPTSTSSPSSTSPTRPGSPPTSTPKPSRTASTCAPSATSSPTPPGSRAASTSTTPSSTGPTGPRGRPATTTPRPSAAPTTAPRPTSATRSDNSGRTTTSGAPPTA